MEIVSKLKFDFFILIKTYSISSDQEVYFLSPYLDELDFAK